MTFPLHTIAPGSRKAARDRSRAIADHLRRGNAFTAIGLGNLTASDLKGVMTTHPHWRVYSALHSLTSAGMDKATMVQTCVDMERIAAQPFAAPAPAQPPAPEVEAPPVEAPEVEAEAPEAEAPEVEAPAPAPFEAPGADPLDTLRPFIRPDLLAPVETAIATMRREHAEALDAARDAARAAARAASGGMPAPAAPLPSLGSQAIGAALGARFAGAYAGLTVEVCGSPLAPPVDRDYIWPEGTAVAVAMLEAGQSVFLFGPAGTGKTTFAEQYAARTGRPFYPIAFHKEKSAHALLGGTVPDGKGGMRWQDGELLAAIKTPGAVILLDEIGLARSGLIAPLLAILGPGRSVMLEDGTHVPVAPGVRFLAANNDDGTGSTGAAGRYVDLSPINEALRDRFAVRVPVGYLDKARQIRALASRSGVSRAVAGLMVGFAQHAQEAVDRADLEHGVGLRRLIAWASLVGRGLPSRDAFAFAVIHGTPAEDAETLRQLESGHLGDHGAIDAAQAGTPIPDPAPAPEGGATPFE